MLSRFLRANDCGSFSKCVFIQLTPSWRLPARAYAEVPQRGERTGCVRQPTQQVERVESVSRKLGRQYSRPATALTFIEGTVVPNTQSGQSGQCGRMSKKRQHQRAANRSPGRTMIRLAPATAPALSEPTPATLIVPRARSSRRHPPATGNGQTGTFRHIAFLKVFSTGKKPRL